MTQFRQMLFLGNIKVRLKKAACRNVFLHFFPAEASVYNCLMGVGSKIWQFPSVFSFKKEGKRRVNKILTFGQAYHLQSDFSFLS